MPSIWDAPPAIQTEPPARRRRSGEFDLLADMGGGSVASLPPVDEDPFGFLPPAPEPRPPKAFEPPKPASEPVPPFEPEPDGPGYLGTIGDVLDRPDNAFRGILAGRVDPLLGLIPFGETLGLYDPEKNRVSGRDVLNKWGWKNDEKEGFLTPAGLAGFALELAGPSSLLPGMMGIKAATKAGKAARVVGSQLADADKAVKAAKFGERGLKQAIEAGEQAGKVWDEASIAAAREALPKAKTDLFGDLLGEGGKQLPDAELVQRIAGRADEVGKASQELLESGAQAFRPLENAGDRVRAGQEALLSVGGDWDPFGLFRLGGKYNPINALPSVPGLTAPLELPQRTLIEGADAAQKLQDAWRGLGELPGIKQAKAIFSEVPGAPAASQEALQQFAKESRQDVRAGGAAAEEGARALDKNIKGMGNVEVSPKPPELLKEAVIDPAQAEGMIRTADGELVDPLTGELLAEGPMPNPLGEAPAKTIPIKPEYEDFETPQKGHVVKFYPKDSRAKITNARRQQYDQIQDVFEQNGVTYARTKQGWEVPLEKVERPPSRVSKDFKNAVRKYEGERMFGDSLPEETEAIKQQALDTRRTLEELHGGRGDLIGWKRADALKSTREDLMREMGLTEFGDLEQAQALPRALEDALDKGVVPTLKSVEFVSFDNGAVGIGDEIPLAGDLFRIESVNPNTGKVRLQNADGNAIEVPADFVPKDKGATIRPASTDAELSQRAEGFDILEDLAGGATGKEALQVPPQPAQDFSKLNKAADILADLEAKKGITPFNRDVPDILPDPETVADLGRSEVPDVLENLMKPQAPVAIRNPGASSIGEAANPAYMREFSDRASEAAGRAVDAREATRQGIIDSGGAGEAAVDRFRAQDNAARQAEATAKAAQKLADAGEDLQQANAKAREMMQGRSVEAGKAITEALERPGAMVTPQEVTETVDKIRARYDEIIKLERDITPELVDARVKYVTHVPTESGRTFFRKMGKDRGSQAALFVELEKKRIAAGLQGDIGAAAAEATARGSDLPTDPAFRAEVQANRAQAKRQGSGKSKPVPANVVREWETAAAQMEPAARKFIEENGLMQEYLAFGKDFALEHGSQIPRLKQYKGLTVNELNDVMGGFAQRMGLKGEIYNSNPAAQLFTREIRHAKVMAGKSFLEKTAEQFGKPGANVGEVMKNIEDLSPEAFGRQLGIEDPQTAKAAYDTLRRLTDEEEVGQLLGWFDKITRGWKGWITRGFPAYHMRNHVSNRFQGWLGGVPLAGDHIELGHKLTAGTDFKFTAGDGKILDRDALLKEMQQTGAVKGGFFEQNLTEQLDETASQWDFFNPNNKFITGAERVSAGLAGGGAQILAGGAKNLTKMDGNAIEAADRASVFIHFRKQGFSPRAAAQKVDELLFDYSKENLSPFEQKYLNRAVFFYGYTRNVLPFVARAMSENGAKVAQLLKLGTQPGRPDFVPEYAAAGLQVPLGTDAEGNSKMAYSLGTPIESASEMFAQNPLTSLNPLIKMPLELAVGKDFFLGKDIADAKKAPNWVDNAPDVLQDMLGTVKTTTKTGGQRVEIDPNIAYALRNNPLSRIGTTASKVFDERKEPLDILQNLLSGARVVSIDDEQEEAWRRKDKAREMLRDLARQGKAKVGKYESFGRGEGVDKGEDPMLDMLLRAAAGK